MPEYTYVGPMEKTFPEDKDVHGGNLGTVKPGDVAELDEAPNQDWLAYDEGGKEAAEALRAAEKAGDEAGPLMLGNFAGPAFPPQPDRNRDYQVPPSEAMAGAPAGTPAPQPVPAPPAVIPPVS